MRSFAFVLILLAAAAAMAQSPTPMPAVPKSISGGVLNGKALNLVRPEFPAAARSVRACGAVNVQVKIDTEGTIVEAAAVSGHPLLRAAAVDAARKSTFAPTRLSGQPVTVSGIIVYNFACEISLLEIGYELSDVEHGGTSIRASDAAARLPAEWSEEIKRFGNLPRLISNRRMVTKSIEPGDRALVSEPIAGNSSETAPDVAARELISMIESRLANDPERSWSFLIGVGAARLVAATNDPEAFNAAEFELRSLIDRAPANASKSVLSAVRDLLEAARPATEDPAAKEAMMQKAAALKSIKFAI